MQGSLQKSLEHAQSMSYLGSRYSERKNKNYFLLLCFFFNLLFKNVVDCFAFTRSFARRHFWIIFFFFYFLSIIGSSWTTAIKELIEHYSQREASYPVLKQVILENFRKIKSEKVDEHSKVKENDYFLLFLCFY